MEKPVKKGRGTYCCVFECHNNTSMDDVKFFRVVRSDKNQTEEWTKAISRINTDGTPWKPNINTRICAIHFLSGQPSKVANHPDYIPSHFPSKHKKEKTEQDLSRHERVKEKMPKRPLEEPVSPPPSKHPRVLEKLAELDLSELTPQKILAAQRLIIQYLKSLTHLKMPDVIKEALEALQNCDILSEDFNAGSSVTFTTLSSVCNEESKIDIAPSGSVKKKNRSTQTKPNNKEITNRALSSCFKCRSYTGLPLIVMKQMKHDLEGQFLKLEKLSADDQLVIFYHKLKSNITFNSLSVTYDVSPEYISQVFENTRDILFDHAKERIFWLSKQVNQAMMPESFKLKYPTCRGIIDCYEVKTENPSRVAHSVLAYSNYKKSPTIKGAITIAPCGIIQHVSRGFGGRATDGEITVKSGLLDFLEPGDSLMADKGFPRVEEDLVRQGCFLIMPPFMRQGRQLEPKQRKENRDIAKERIHVERAIERLRRFEVMRFMSHHMYKHFNKLIVILSYTVNQFGPLIRDKNTFMEKVEDEDDLEEDIDAIMAEFENQFGEDNQNENNSDDDITFHN